MNKPSGSERALRVSALFVFAFLLWAVYAPAVWSGGVCPADRIDEWVRVSYVYDGDTLKLADGRHVRLIGINTPEIGHDGKPSQPYGPEARKALLGLLGTDARIGLRYDTERHDVYKRKLAHLYLRDGTSVEAWLLEHGYATILPIPPNTWNIACYHNTEARARQAGRGVWSLPAYRPVSANKLDHKVDGYRFIEGRVLRYSKKHNALWVTLEGDVVLRVDHKDLAYFTDLRPESLVNRRLIVRGWVDHHDNAFYMHIRHPFALELLP